MNFNQKLVLLSVLPVLIAVICIGFAVNHQTRILKQNQSEDFYEFVLKLRKNELRQYTQMAKSSIRHVYENTNFPEKDAQEAVKRILNNLEYSQDGYFYAYDQQGVNIVHPKQPFRVGEQWLELQDSNGKYVIQELISRANDGGGFTEYIWEKPSSKNLATKIGYTENLERWNWMFGTGAYIDDIEDQVNAINQVMEKHIRNTSLTLLAIAVLSIISAFICSLLLQISEKKLADQKLQELAMRVVTTQDDERRRVARELHDGISQSLVAVKFAIEEAEHLQKRDPDASLTVIQKSADMLDNTLSDVRRISKDLHPSVLDDLGLIVAVESLADEFTNRTGVDTKLNTAQVRNLLPQEAKTALYRIVQEAFNNIEKYANATEVEVEIVFQDEWLKLSVKDNGIGFNPSKIKTGLGFRSMSERLEHLNGRLDVKSSDNGTSIYAYLPKAIILQKQEGSTA
jgi:two-component system NarL family sensor kinase